MVLLRDLNRPVLLSCYSTSLVAAIFRVIETFLIEEGVLMISLRCHYSHAATMVLLHQRLNVVIIHILVDVVVASGPQLFC